VNSSGSVLPLIRLNAAAKKQEKTGYGFLNAIKSVCLLIYLVSVGYLLHDFLASSQRFVWKTERLSRNRIYKQRFQKPPTPLTLSLCASTGRSTERFPKICQPRTWGRKQQPSWSEHTAIFPLVQPTAQNGWHALHATLQHWSHRLRQDTRKPPHYTLASPRLWGSTRATLVARLTKLSYYHQWSYELWDSCLTPPPLKH
jgi:hypothetical protein